MDLKQLEYFVRVAELGSFTRAAVALQVAQPALSRQVRLLEVELRQNLLVRNGRGATPTEAGKLLLAHGRGILHQVEHAREDLGRLRGALAGRVAIGLPTSVARVLAVPLTRAFRQEMPDAQLSISEGLTAAMSEGVNTGRLDIVVLYNARSGDGLDVTPVLQEELVLVAPRPPGLAEDPPPPPLPWPELARLPLIIPTRPNAIRMHVEAEMASHGLRPLVSLEIDGVSAILDLVADGAGCAILTRNAVAKSLKPSAYTQRPIGPPLLRIDLGVAVSSQRPTTLTQQAALRLVHQQLRLAIPGVPLPHHNNS